MNLRTGNSPESSKPIVRFALHALALLILALVAFGPSLGGSFIWDDPDYVVNNATLRSIDGLVQIWLKPSTLPQYYPLVHSTLWIEYHLWGLEPVGFKLVNVLLHVSSALLI